MPIDGNALRDNSFLHSPGECDVVVSGMNHRSAGIEFREKFAVSSHNSQKTLSVVLQTPGIKEAVVVSTCNRVELITSIVPQHTRSPSPEISSHEIRRTFQGIFEELSGLEGNRIAQNLYLYRDWDAVSHVFRVACSLDSMVVGEPQILGQLKEAYHLAQAVGATSALLNRLFHRAFGVAKVVRTKTNIGRNAVSISFAARELARKIFDDLGSATVMLLGAGEIGALTVKHFHSTGVKQIFVINRTVERAVDLASSIGAIPLRLEQLPQFLSQADIVIGTCMLSNESPPLVTQSMMKTALRHRPDKPQFFIDLSVPRNFSADLGDLPGVYLYNIDDLQEIVQNNLEGRTLEINHAEMLVNEEVERFFAWRNQQSVAPTIREFGHKLTVLKDNEIKTTLRRLRREGVSDNQQALFESALEDFSRALLAKTFHQPLTALKEHGTRDRALEELFRELFLKR